MRRIAQNEERITQNEELLSEWKAEHREEMTELKKITAIHSKAILKLLGK